MSGVLEILLLTSLGSIYNRIDNLSSLIRKSDHPKKPVIHIKCSLKILRCLFFYDEVTSMFSNGLYINGYNVLCTEAQHHIQILHEQLTQNTLLQELTLVCVQQKAGPKQHHHNKKPTFFTSWMESLLFSVNTTIIIFPNVYYFVLHSQQSVLEIN